MHSTPAITSSNFGKRLYHIEAFIPGLVNILGEIDSMCLFNQWLCKQAGK
jgi:hypothetical protein